METHRLALIPGFRLDNFQIERILGKGGFGITYVALDLQLGKRVAVKELLPDSIATRVEGSTVVPQTASMQESWEWARARFLEEAQILAGFSHPAIVGVHRLIEANGTVYMVMDFIDGESYESRLRRIGRESSQEALMEVIAPILDGLREVHSKNLLHRDIKPENILLSSTGQPMLIDFGSARTSIGATMSMTSIVTHGYSPIEQYQTKGRMGAWTDIYALGAVMCRAITGEKPPVAADRIVQDDFEWVSNRKPAGYDETFLNAVDWALRVRVEDRPQNISAFAQHIRHTPTPSTPPPLPTPPPVVVEPSPVVSTPTPNKEKNNNHTNLLVLAIAILTVLVFYFLGMRGSNSSKASADAIPKPEAIPIVAAPVQPSPAPAVQPDLPQAATDQPAANQKPAAEADKPIKLPEVVATVNGKDITRDQLQDIFNAAVQSSGMNIADLSTAQQLGGYSQLLNDLIDRQLLLEAASKEVVTKEDVDAEIKKFKSQFPDKGNFDSQMKQAGMTSEKLRNDVIEELKIRRWTESQASPQEVTQADVKSFYKSNQKEFEQPETIKASHILFMAEANASPDVVKQKERAAKKAVARAKSGEDFTQLAKELSEEPGARESGGDLGFFPKDRMVPEFANVAFAANINDISDPVKTQFGWHIIKVTDRKPAGIVPFNEVQDQITSYLKATRQREAVQNVMKELKDLAVIQTYLPSSE
jgi:serine/threonine protein kinase